MTDAFTAFTSTEDPEHRGVAVALWTRRAVMALVALVVAAGELLRVTFQFQVNPTNIGSHPFGVELDDGTTRVARVERAITALP